MNTFKVGDTVIFSPAFHNKYPNDTKILQMTINKKYIVNRVPTDPHLVQCIVITDDVGQQIMLFFG